VGLTRQAGAGMSQVARDISVGSNQLLDGGASTRVMGKPFQGPVYLERQELLALKRELARVKGIERRLLRMGQVPAEPRAIDNLSSNQADPRTPHGQRRRDGRAPHA
jgi:transposase-like protein